MSSLQLTIYFRLGFRKSTERIIIIFSFSLSSFYLQSMEPSQKYFPAKKSDTCLLHNTCLDVKIEFEATWANQLVTKCVSF